MGYLHAGHISLVKLAKKYQGSVVVSIFVNPTQFGPKEDFQKYPRNIKNDIKLLKQAGVTAIFSPSVLEMYGENVQQCSKVLADEQLKNKLCGLSRPGHFDGVVTIVARLFNIIQPQFAIFGKKDYQQYLVLKKMASDLKYPVKIIGAPLIREKDGLAMSSRNVYLSAEARQNALIVSQTLALVKKALRSGLSVATARDLGRESLARETTIRFDYLEIVNAQNLESILEYNSGKTLIAVAVFVGKTRLIDNLIC